MTCVIGYVLNEKIYLAGDKLAASPDFKANSSVPKVFKKSGILFGMAGSYRMIQIVHHLLKIPKQPETKTFDSTYKWLVKSFIPALQREFEKHKSGNDGEDDQEFPEMILGLNGTLWMVQCDFSVIHYEDNFGTIGSGGMCAYGSIKTFFELKDIQTEDDVIQLFGCAIKATSEICPSVGSDFEVISG